MIEIKSHFSEKDTIFSTLIKGINIQEIEGFGTSTRDQPSNFWDEGKKRFFVPGVMIISMFRYVVEKLYKENNDFPIKKLSNFYGSNGGTKENRLFINEELRYEFVVRSFSKKKYFFEVEVLRNKTNEIVLNGLFQFE